VRESPREAVVTAQAIREPNKNPISKICSGQTSPTKKASRPPGSPRCGIFILYFYSLIPVQVTPTLFVSFLDKLLRRSLDSHGQQAHRDIDANVRGSVDFMTASSDV